MSFTRHKLGNIDSLADAAKTVLEGKINVYELAAELTDEDASSFIAAALAAKEEGKSHFMFNGKDYPVTVGEDVAKQVEDKLDPVGKEDDDVDNDGDVDDSDEYLKKRRDAIDKAIDDEEETEESVQEKVGESEDGVYKSNDEIAPDTKTGHADADDEPEVKDGEEEESEKPKEVKPKKMKESTKKRRTKKAKVESIQSLVDGLVGISETAQALSDKMAARFDIDEGKMKELHQDIEAGKSADEIIKINKLPNTPGMKKYINALIKDIKG
jgi:hypothetical protein